MKINSHEIFQPDSIEFINSQLFPLSMRVEKGESLDPYTSFAVMKDDKVIFETIYSKELLVKIAQLLPETNVRLGRYSVSSGGDDLSQETLVIEF